MVVAALLVFCTPAIAFADSDGYYCQGQGYLAYQFGMAPLPVAPHRLYVISTRGPRGIPEPAALELPQFQVHGMVCGAGWVDVASFTMIYRVTLDGELRPVRYGPRASLERGAIPPEFIRSQLQNLGASAGGRVSTNPVRTSLGANALGGQYVLQISAKAIGPVRQCEVAITSRIVETDRNGREVGERLIFQGRGHRECGGG